MERRWDYYRSVFAPSQISLSMVWVAATLANDEIHSGIHGGTIGAPQDILIADQCHPGPGICTSCR